MPYCDDPDALNQGQQGDCNYGFGTNITAQDAASAASHPGWGGMQELYNEYISAGSFGAEAPDFMSFMYDYGEYMPTFTEGGQQVARAWRQGETEKKKITAEFMLGGDPYSDVSGFENWYNAPMMGDMSSLQGNIEDINQGVAGISFQYADEYAQSLLDQWSQLDLWGEEAEGVTDWSSLSEEDQFSFLDEQAQWYWDNDPGGLNMTQDEFNQCLDDAAFDAASPSECYSLLFGVGWSDVGGGG